MEVERGNGSDSSGEIIVESVVLGRPVGAGGVAEEVPGSFGGYCFQEGCNLIVVDISRRVFNTVGDSY